MNMIEFTGLDSRRIWINGDMMVHAAMHPHHTKITCWVPTTETDLELVTYEVQEMGAKFTLAVNSRSFDKRALSHRLERATSFLLDLLSDGPKLIEDIYNTGEEHGHKRDTIRRARVELDDSIVNVKIDPFKWSMMLLPKGQKRREAIRDLKNAIRSEEH